MYYDYVALVVKEKNTFNLQLSFWEKIFSLHGNLKVSLDQLEKTYEVQNPWSKGVLKGVRAPGTGIPFKILLGTMRYKGGKDFTAIYKRKPVTVYEFKDYEFKRWIVTQ